MANETIAQIEDAIIAALAPLTVAQGGYVKEISTYQGQLDQNTIQEIVEKLASNFPAIMVIYLGSKLKEDPTYVYDDRQSWGIFLAAQNLRGEQAARRGAGGDQGTYQMIVDVRAKLAGNWLGLFIQPLSLKSIDSILVGEGLSVYGMTYESLIDYQATEQGRP